jgi:hypothetical protein
MDPDPGPGVLIYWTTDRIGYGSGTPVHFHGNKSFGKKVSVVHNLKSGTFIFYQEKAQ